MPLNKKIEKSILKLRSGMRAQRALTTGQKNKLLSDLATALEKEGAPILMANAKDLKDLKSGTAPAFRDRLTLDSQRLKTMAESLRQVAALPDPVNEVLEERTLPNGLKLKKIRAPLGLILMIFESRPNVILEAFSLAFKSGNSIVLRGGSESKHSARAIYKLMNSVIGPAAFYGIEDYDRAHIANLLKRKDLIDITVPRGGDKLIAFVQKTAAMPIIKNDRGMCHAYVDSEADLEMAVRIVTNAKLQRPGVCNSLETVLVHKSVASTFIPRLYAATSEKKLIWKTDAASFALLRGQAHVEKAKDKAWDTEYLDLILNCRIVDDLEQALGHIEKHGSKHSETIITKSETKARRFQAEIDAAAVYWNASTRFTDGFQFGLGGELGISTQKLHVRGPVGLRELTTPRWIGDGTGQIRE
jgi:glutamate-5-semialdehyde dehydrogenase